MHGDTSTLLPPGRAWRGWGRGRPQLGAESAEGGGGEAKGRHGGESGVDPSEALKTQVGLQEIIS